MTIATDAQRFNTASALADAAATILSEIVNGDDQTEVATDNGPTPSIKKFYADMTTLFGLVADNLAASAEWANGDEDTLVSVGDQVNDYSSLHWSEKSKAWFKSFSDIYYGALSEDPIVSPSGAAMNAGDLYYHTTDELLKYYNGSTWSFIDIPASQNIIFTANETPLTSDNMRDAIEEVYLSTTKGAIDLKGKYNTTGSNNNYVLAPDVALTAHERGVGYVWRANHTNTGNTTITISGLSAKPLLDRRGIQIAPGLIESGRFYYSVYDGTNYHVINLQLTNSLYYGSGKRVEGTDAGATITGVAKANKDGAPAHVANRSADDQVTGFGISTNGVSNWAFLAKDDESGDVTLQANDYKATGAKKVSVVDFRYATGIVDFLQGLRVNGATVWHADNDGLDSGLDSDTMRGQHWGAITEDVLTSGTRISASNDGSNLARWLDVINSKRSVSLTVDSSGNGGLYDNTNNRWILESDKASGETNLYVGNVKTLKLNSDGVTVEGTINSTGKIQARTSTIGLVIERTDNNNANHVTYAQFNNSSGSLVGSISCNVNSTSYNTTSDHRLKKYVKPVSDEKAIEAIEALRPVTYKWKGSKEKLPEWGFIAHEVQEVYPQAIIGEKDEMFELDGKKIDVYQSMDYSKLTAFNTAGIKALLNMIRELQEEIETLRKSHAEATSS